MTLEKLLGGNADYLESLTDKELKEFFAPYLTVTRPDQATSKRLQKIGESPRVNKTKQNERNDKMSKLQELWLAKTGKRLEL